MTVKSYIGELRDRLRFDADCRYRAKARGAVWNTSVLVTLSDKTTMVIYNEDNIAKLDEDTIGAVFFHNANGNWSGMHKCPCIYSIGITTLTAAGKTHKECRDNLAKALREHRARRNELKDPVKALERRLKGHDWWYVMSDDGSVVRAGAAAHKVLYTKVKELPPETVRELWAKHAPKDFACPV